MLVSSSDISGVLPMSKRGTLIPTRKGRFVNELAASSSYNPTFRFANPARGRKDATAMQRPSWGVSATVKALPMLLHLPCSLTAQACGVCIYGNKFSLLVSLNESLTYRWTNVNVIVYDMSTAGAKGGIVTKFLSSARCRESLGSLDLIRFQM